MQRPATSSDLSVEVGQAHSGSSSRDITPQVSARRVSLSVPTPQATTPGKPPNTPSASGTPWRRRVESLQEDIALALASTASPGDANARRNEVRARHLYRRMQITRGFNALLLRQAVASSPTSICRTQRMLGELPLRRAYEHWVATTDFDPSVPLKALRRPHHLRIGFVALRHAATTRSSIRTCALIGDALARSLRNSRRLRFFVSWRAAAGTVTAEVRRARVALGEWRGGCFRRGWLRWCDNHRTARLVRAAAMGWFHAAARRALTSWVDRASELAERSRQLRRVLTALAPDRRDLRRAFMSLIYGASLGTRRRRAMAGFMRLREMRALNTWRAQASRRARALGLLVGSVAALRSIGTRRALSSWVGYAEVSARCHQLLRRGGAALLRRAMRLAFTSWQEFAEARSENLRLLRRSISTLLMRGRSRALRQWTECARERLDAMARLHKAGAALAHASSHRALMTWSHNVLLEERALARLHRIFSPKLRLLARALQSMMHAAECQRVLMRALSGFLHGHRLRALNTWRVVAQTRAHAMGLMHSSLAALVSAGRAKAFHSWCEHTDAVRRGAARVRTAIGEWQGVAFRGAWFTWVDATSQRATLISALSGLRHRHARRAFNSLAHFATKRREAIFVVLGLRNRHVRRALNAWMGAAEALAGARGQLRRALAAMHPRTRHMRRAYLRICQVCGRRQLMHRAGNVFRDARRLQAYNTWAEYMYERRAALELLERALAGMSEGAALRVMNTWIAHVQQRARCFKLLRRGANALRKAGMRRSFMSWIEFSLGLAPQLRILLKGAAAFLRLGEVLAFNKWAERSRRLPNPSIQGFAAFGIHTSSVRRAFESLCCMLRGALVLRRAVSAFARASEVRAIRTWQEATGHLLKQTALLRQGLMALVMHEVYRAFGAWHDLAVAARRRWQLLQRAAMAIGARGLRCALTTWCAATDEHAERMRLLRQGGTAMLYAEARRALMAWADNVERHRRAMARIVRIFSPELRGMSRAFNSLRGEERARHALRRALAGFVHAQRLRALNTWAEFALHTGSSMERLGVALAEWRGAAFTRAWYTWLDENDKGGAMRRAVVNIRRRLERRALNQWADTLDANETWRRLRRRLQLLLLGASERVLRKKWRRWRTTSAKRIRIRAARIQFANNVRVRGLIKVKMALTEWGAYALPRAMAQRDAALDAAPPEAVFETGDEPSTSPNPSVVHVVHHHRGLGNHLHVPPVTRSRTWSTASTRAKSHVPYQVAPALGAAYMHQLEESQMMAAVQWRAQYEGVPPNLARALEAADSFNHLFDGAEHVIHHRPYEEVYEEVLREEAEARHRGHSTPLGTSSLGRLEHSGDGARLSGSPPLPTPRASLSSNFASPAVGGGVADRFASPGSIYDGQRSREKASVAGVYDISDETAPSMTPRATGPMRSAIAHRSGAASPKWSAKWRREPMS